MLDSTAESPSTATQSTAPGALQGGQVWVAHWAVFCVSLVLLQACVRLGQLAWEAMTMPLSGMQVALTILWVIFNGYGEGYRAFQLRFSPRVVLRAHELARDPSPLKVLLAPFYCMNLVYAPKVRLIISWLAVGLIFCAVYAVRQLDQPWRGIVDMGVVVALAWGIIAMVYFHLRALRTGQMPVVAERRRRKSKKAAQDVTVAAS